MASNGGSVAIRVAPRLREEDEGGKKSEWNPNSEKNKEKREATENGDKKGDRLGFPTYENRGSLSH